jgi:hypothetical protein
VVDPEVESAARSGSRAGAGPRRTDRSVGASEVEDRLLRLLDAHRVLTTEQMQTITGAPERTTEYRLARLATRGLAGRVRPPRAKGSHPWHWWLTPAGARLVTGTACAVDRGGPNPLFVAHAAAVAEVWIALTGRGPAAGLSIERWWRDSHGWQEWQPSSAGVAGRVRRITPDATAWLRLDGLAADDAGAPAVGAVLVEVDLATMTAERLRHKLYRYRDYAADRAWAGRHPHCPVLLVLTTSPARAATFLRGAAAVLPRPRPIYDEDQLPGEADRLVVAACGHVRDPQAAVTGRVWMLPGDTAEITLTDLLADRITLARRAEVIRARAARERAAADRRATLQSLAGDPRAVPALREDPAAARVLRAVQADEELADWVAANGEAGAALLDWWITYARDRYRPAGPPPATVAAALAGDFTTRWRAQVETLLAATAAIRLRRATLAGCRHASGQRPAAHRVRAT